MTKTIEVKCKCAPAVFRSKGIGQRHHMNLLLQCARRDRCLKGDHPRLARQQVEEIVRGLRVEFFGLHIYIACQYSRAQLQSRLPVHSQPRSLNRCGGGRCSSLKGRK